MKIVFKKMSKVRKVVQTWRVYLSELKKNNFSLILLTAFVNHTLLYMIKTPLLWNAMWITIPLCSLQVPYVALKDEF